MAIFCHFWRITPDQFEHMDARAYHAFIRYMNEWQREQEKQQNR